MSLNCRKQTLVAHTGVSELRENPKHSLIPLEMHLYFKGFIKKGVNFLFCL